MNLNAFENICQIFDAHNSRYVVYEHRPCGPSVEASVVREELGIKDHVGAKALLLKMYLKGGGEIFAVFVLPGTHKLVQSALKQIPDYKLNRFASKEEMMEVAGVAPGCMPPFGKDIFPKISRLYVCENLLSYKDIAFNAAFFERTITVPSEDYIKTISPDMVFSFSELK